jgi:hypothetical protein
MTVFLVKNLNLVHGHDGFTRVPSDSSVGSAMTNYCVYETSVAKYVACLRQMSDKKSASSSISDLVTSMSAGEQTSFLKTIFRNVKSGEEAYPILCAVPVELLKPVFVKILFSRTSFAQSEMFGQLVCFLSMALDSDNFVQVFKNDCYINIGKSIVFFLFSNVLN